MLIPLLKRYGNRLFKFSNAEMLWESERIPAPSLIDQPRSSDNMKRRKPIGRPRAKVEMWEKKFERDFVKMLEEELDADLAPISSDLFKTYTMTYTESRAEGHDDEKAGEDAIRAAIDAALFTIARAGGDRVKWKKEKPVYDISKLRFDAHGIQRAHRIAAEIASVICKTDIPAWDIDEHRENLYQAAYGAAFFACAIDPNEINIQGVAIGESIWYMTAIAVGRECEEKVLPHRVPDIGWNTSEYCIAFRRRMIDRFLNAGADLKKSEAMAENAVRMVLIRDAFDPDARYTDVLVEEPDLGFYL